VMAIMELKEIVVPKRKHAHDGGHH
jgi:hypothetical protein